MASMNNQITTNELSFLKRIPSIDPKERSNTIRSENDPGSVSVEIDNSTRTTSTDKYASVISVLCRK
jgi:hypothetical protein